MITLNIFKNKSNKRYKGFSLSGHAGYADKGSDIICAAVSALSINTVNSIEKFTDDKFNVNVDEASGVLTFEFTGEVSDESVLLINSMILGIQGIDDDYDIKYIEIFFKEV